MARAKKDGTPRKSSTGGPGPRRVDMSNWRQKLQASRIKFDDDAKATFLAEYRKHGLMYVAAEAANVTTITVRGHLENDPDFGEAFQAAKDAYRDHIRSQVYKLAVVGVREPIIGGKDKDEIVAYKQVYATNLLAMEARRVDPDYKDRQQIDMNVQGGVLVAPARMTPEEWTKAALEYKNNMPSEESWRKEREAEAARVRSSED